MSSKFSRGIRPLGQPIICLKPPPPPPGPGLPPIESLALQFQITIVYLDPPIAIIQGVAENAALIHTAPWNWFIEWNDPGGNPPYAVVNFQADASGIWWLTCASIVGALFPVNLFIPPTMRDAAWPDSAAGTALLTDSPFATASLDLLQYF